MGETSDQESRHLAITPNLAMTFAPRRTKPKIVTAKKTTRRIHSQLCEFNIASPPDSLRKTDQPPLIYIYGGRSIVIPRCQTPPVPLLAADWLSPRELCDVVMPAKNSYRARLRSFVA